MHVYLHWIATDETERRRAKQFCRESRLRDRPFIPTIGAPTISQLPLPLPPFLQGSELFAPSRSSLRLAWVYPVSTGKPRAISFSLVFPPDARFSNGPHTSRPGHAHTRTGLSPSPPSPPFRKPAILFRTSFRTRWGRPPAPRPADSICQPKVVFFFH